MYSVLIVDDEENIRKSFIKSIDWESVGFNIVGEASNGFEALDYIENNEIDLLVSDIKMPIMGGIELARAAREIRPSMQIVFLSGYDHFQYAKQAIHYNILEYILKPITPEEIKIEFKKIKEKLDGKFSEILDIDNQIDAIKELDEVKKDLFLCKLINGGILEEQLENELFELNINTSKKANENSAFVLCIAKIKTNIKNDKDKTIIYKRLLNISRIVSRKYINCETFLYGDKVIIIAWDTSKALDKYLSILSKDIVMSAKRIMGIEVIFAQSNYFFEVLQTHIAYLDTNDALISIERSGEDIVHINDVMSKTEDIQVQELIYELEEKIIAADSKNVINLLDKAFAEIQERNISGNEFNVFILELLSIIFKTRRMLNDDGKIKELISKFISFNGSRSVIQEEIKNLCFTATTEIEGQRKKTVGFLVSEAIKIISDEYSNPELSLKTLADELHCSPNYLSSIIKKSVKKTFIELLTETRMKKAKEMLLTSNKKIREISDECGFANQHYFSYSFKKFYNSSPNSIRKVSLDEIQS